MEKTVVYVEFLADKGITERQKVVFMHMVCLSSHHTLSRMSRSDSIYFIKLLYHSPHKQAQAISCVDN